MHEHMPLVSAMMQYCGRIHRHFHHFEPKSPFSSTTAAELLTSRRCPSPPRRLPPCSVDIRQEDLEGEDSTGTMIIRTEGFATLGETRYQDLHDIDLQNIRTEAPAVMAHVEPNEHAWWTQSNIYIINNKLQGIEHTEGNLRHSFARARACALAHSPPPPAPSKSLHSFKAFHDGFAWCTILPWLQGVEILGQLPQ